ncbi:MAG: MASE1 domain-containing protein [Betaproteobacteria bacterium]|nr:MASE1 domain-containing protein [Betaproteobacteria bacterium]
MAAIPNPFQQLASPASATRPLWVDVAWVLTFGAVYVALFTFAVSLPFRAGVAACIWPADGLAVGVLMRARYRQWPAYCLMIMAANVIGGQLAGFKFTLDAFISMNAIQPALAAWLMRRYFNLPRNIDTVFGIVVFALISAVVTAGASVMGAFDDSLRGDASHWLLFKALLISDVLGIITVAPLILAWSREGRQHLRINVKGREIEAAAVFAGLVISTHVVFSATPDARGWVPQLQHLTTPFLVWAALRFGLRGSTLALAIYALMTVWYTTNGTGPFISAHADPGTTLLALQVYVGLLGVMILIGAALMTERRDAFADSESWRQRFEAAIEASGNLVFEIHADTGHIDWAGDTQAVLGLSARDLDTTRLWTARVHPDDRERLLGIRRKLASGELKSLMLEYRVRRSDDEYRLISVSAYSVEAPASELSVGRARGRRIIGFVEDITEARRADEERTRLEVELRHAQKMEAIGQLAGGIAHDFNNILASILGYGEMARKRAQDTTLQRHLDTILKAGERGRVLVSQILTFSRKTPVERITLNIDDVLDEVALLVRGSSPHDVRMVRHCPEHLAVDGNPTELHQLFMNLATNGLQAMPAGGVLEIEADRVELTAPHAVIQDNLPSGSYAKVRIRDHGVGIDAAARERMFEPFFTTKPSGRGTGLGLSLAMAVAKAHGGGIEVESLAGEGTTFTVYLPLSGAPATAAPDVETELPRGHDQRILIVDDELPLLELAEEILAELGYQTAVFNSSVEALAAFEQRPDRFDAVLTDEIMPTLTGTQLAAKLHALRPTLPILIITAYGGPGFELRAQQAGVAKVLKKPYQRAELAHALATILPQPK